MNLTTLTLAYIVRREEKKPSRVDQRRKLTRVTASYTGDDGHEESSADGRIGAHLLSLREHSSSGNGEQNG